MNSLDFVFSFICHQLPDRCPTIGNEVFPLCFRCIGIYIGAASAYVYLLISGGFTREIPALRSKLLLGFSTFPLWLDGYGNLLNFWQTTGELRFATGLLTGLAVPLLLCLLTEKKTGRATPISSSALLLMLLSAIIFWISIKELKLVFLLKISLLIGILFNFYNFMTILGFFVKKLFLNQLSNSD